MRVLRGTLTFVLGMVIGIILFVLAIGGAVVVLGTRTTVGQLQQNFTQNEIVSSDSKLYDQTILDAVMSLYEDMQNFDKLTMQTLYEHYGIALLKGISGIDFTTKDFYTAPVSEIMNDLSIVINSFTLDDISGLADVDFSEFGLPILNDNLDKNVKTAIENIMGSLNGNMSVRKIKDNFGIDIGTEDNKLLSSVQDVSLSSFGKIVNAITLDKILNVDTDSFIVKGANRVFVKADEYVQIGATDLKNKDFVPAIGVETYIADAIDTDGDGTTDKLVEKELRYVKKNVKDADGNETEKYVVDNSCYDEDFNADETDKTFYRHVQYKTPSQEPSPASVYIVTYANRIATIAGENFTLVTKEFTPITDISFVGEPSFSVDDNLNVNLNVTSVKYKLEDDTYEESASFYMMDVSKDSMLRTLEKGETAGERTAYLRTHKGTSAPVLQIVAYMSVVELQNADGLLDSLTIGDVVDTEKEGTAKAIIALKNCKITEIGTKINSLTLAETIDINFYKYAEAEAGKTGKYVKIVEDEDFEYGFYYTLYNPALHKGLTTYNRIDEEGYIPSSSVLQRMASSKLSDFSGAFKKLTLGDVMQIDVDTLEHDDSAVTGTSYFYYDAKNHVFLRQTDSVDLSDVDNDYKNFRIVDEGSSSSVIKRLAYVPVDDLSAAMEVVMKDMLFSELIDVYEFSTIETIINDYETNTPADSEIKETDRFIVESVGTDEEGRPFTFVYDKTGKYISRDYRFEKADISKLTKGTSVTYSYVAVTNIDDISANIYYYGTKDGQNEYVYNIPLCSYVAYKNANLLTKQISGGKLFKREVGDGGMNKTVAETYVNDGSLYVLIDGEYVPYDSTNITHLSTDVYVRINEKSFVEKTTPGVFNDSNYAYRKGDIIYAKQYCENIYVKDANGTHVIINGEAVPYDSAVHTDANTRYNVVVGYLAQVNEAYNVEDESSETKSYVSPLAKIRYRVEIENEKSEAVLRMLARKEVTVENINVVVKDATISDLMDVDEGSLFYEFKDKPLNDFSKAVEDKFSSMTMGELLRYANISDIDADVKAAIAPITLNNFFRSLSADKQAGIVINLEKAYGYTA